MWVLDEAQDLATMLPIPVKKLSFEIVNQLKAPQLISEEEFAS